MVTYEEVIIACWAAFIVFWAISAFNVKRDISGGFGNIWRKFLVLRLAVLLVFVYIVIRISSGTAHDVAPSSIFSHGLFPQNPALDWIGAVLSVLGVSFAIWARVNLGRNWSPLPAVKEQHELVTSGPYAYVRHPIYSGLFLMAIGIAITGSVFGIGVLIVSLAIYLIRIWREEKIMLELFPNEYPEYQKRTKRLVPFVW